MGPYLYVRDKETQAVLPIRGKILNTTYKDLKEVIKNKEICDIANSIGCGIGPQCDASKSRYDRVIISADADPDGLQINCLVLAVFVNLFPDMIKQGRVYISLPPLYCWGDSAKNYGWCNRVEDIPSSVKHFHRFKGLGEMEDKELYHFLVNPETRNLIQIEYPSDVEKFNEILGTSSGKNTLLKDLGIVIGEDNSDAI
jgi:DNA gyrase/topoisomerase IV subunit B